MSDPLTFEDSLAKPEARVLLAPDEPEPYELFNRGGKAPLLFICDHASHRLPRALGALGLSEAELSRHIAYDIGIEDVARTLAERLDAPAVFNTYSRLVIDPNRSLDDPTLIPQLGDGVIVPGNRDLPPDEVGARIAEFHEPYHAAIDAMLDELAARGPAPAVISLHSFTPVMKGIERPWQIGILWNEDPRLPVPLMARFRAQGITVGDNEPYSGRDRHGYTLHVHAEPRGLANVLIEMRQDLIDTHHGAAEWTARLGDSLAAILEDQSIFQSVHYE